MNNVPLPQPKNPRRVWVVHGRNIKARDAIFDLLSAIGLEPLEWTEAKKLTRKPAPSVKEILETAFSEAYAVVVLLTPDDEARLRTPFRGTKEKSYETALTPQARPNVLFEAGMAMGSHPDGTVLVEFGDELRPFSNIGGLHLIRMDGSVERRQELCDALENAHCEVNRSGTRWHKAGDFDAVLEEIERTSTDSSEAADLLTILGRDLSDSLEDRDKDLLFAIYQYTELHGDGNVSAKDFLNSEQGRLFPSHKLENDISFLVNEGYVYNPDGPYAELVVFRLSPTGFEICADHFEKDFEVFQSHALRTIIDECTGLPPEQFLAKLSRLTDRPSGWTYLLYELFLSRRWIIVDFETRLIRVTSRGLRAAA